MADYSHDNTLVDLRSLRETLKDFTPNAEEQYNKACNTRTDINENLPVLKEYADMCNHVTEMGSRTGQSTWALVASKATNIVLYDINPRVGAFLEPHFICAREENKHITFTCISTISPFLEIEETDLLFIDTLHTYEQLTQELEMHGMKARKYLAFHDTAHPQFGEGLNKAISEFMFSNIGVWEDAVVKENNNGLRILKRVN